MEIRELPDDAGVDKIFHHIETKTEWAVPPVTLSKADKIRDEISAIEAEYDGIMTGQLREFIDAIKELLD